MKSHWPALKKLYQRWLRRSRYKSYQREQHSIVLSLRWLGVASELATALAEQMRKSSSRVLYRCLRHVLSEGTPETNRWLLRAVTGPPTTQEEQWQKAQLVTQAFATHKAPRGLANGVVHLFPAAVANAPWREVARAAHRRLATKPSRSEQLAMLDVLGAAAGRADKPPATVLKPLRPGSRAYGRALSAALSATSTDMVLDAWLIEVGRARQASWTLQQAPPRMGSLPGYRSRYNVLLSLIMARPPNAYKASALRRGIKRAIIDHPRGRLSRLKRCPSKHRAAWQRWITAQAAHSDRPTNDLLMGIFQTCGGDLLTSYHRWSRPERPAREAELLDRTFKLLRDQNTGPVTRPRAFMRAVAQRLTKYDRAQFDSVMLRIARRPQPRWSQMWLDELVPTIQRLDDERFVRGLPHLMVLARRSSTSAQDALQAELTRRIRKNSKNRLLPFLHRLFQFHTRGAPQSELLPLMRLLPTVPIDRFRAFDAVKWMLGTAMDVRTTAPPRSSKWRQQKRQIQLDLYAAEKTLGLTKYPLVKAVITATARLVVYVYNGD